MKQAICLVCLISLRPIKVPVGCRFYLRTQICCCVFHHRPHSCLSEQAGVCFGVEPLFSIVLLRLGENTGFLNNGASENPAGVEAPGCPLFLSAARRVNRRRLRQPVSASPVVPPPSLRTPPSPGQINRQPPVC